MLCEFLCSGLVIHCRCRLSQKRLWLQPASSPAATKSARLPHSTPVPLFSILSPAPAVWLTSCHYTSFVLRKHFYSLTESSSHRCGFDFQQLLSLFDHVAAKTRYVKGQRVCLTSPVVLILQVFYSAKTSAMIGWQQLLKLCPFPVVSARRDRRMSCDKIFCAAPQFDGKLDKEFPPQKEGKLCL